MFHLISDCLRPLHGRPLPDGLNTIRQFLLAAPLALASVLSSLFIPAAQAQNCETLRSAHGEDVISVHCGGAPSASFDHKNHLWVAFVSNKHVYVSRSEDKGTTFSTPVQVNAVPEDAEFNGENRPKIIVADNGTVLLSWTTKTSNRFTGEIRFSRSTDGGRSFEQPRTVNDDGLAIGHRFDSLFLTKSGKLYVTWIDKRDLEASLARSENYPGAAIYYTVSDDLGASFMPNVRVSHNSCECCRIAVAPHGDDNIAILWRQIFGEQIRDHAIAVLSPEGTVSDLSRATIDNWQIDACPHHGPTMVPASSDGQYHMSWFSAGTIHSGIHYARYDLATASPADIIKIDGTPGAGHPSLATFNDTLYLVWKGFDGMSTPLQLMTSNDEGRSWSAPQTLISTDQASDHPLLITSAEGVFLSWSSEQHGYVFKELNND
ncbi:exo-alpha-sialidase [Gammaproteobacteria bacterium LSUCC0112]|nr:exo-alpha-sialidase [Gammaproteobacteria bacterium LSUCC0112]